jgi:hypothetical protein
MISISIAFVVVIALTVYFNIRPADHAWHIIERLVAIILIIVSFVVGSLTAPTHYMNEDKTLDFVKKCTDLSGLAKYIEVDGKPGVACI